MIDFCVLGSGIAGSTIANLLSKKYLVQVFDKARGPGGRSSNKRYKSKYSFDHGVQYIAPRTSQFKRFIVNLAQKKIVKKWNENHLDFTFNSKNLIDRYIGKRANNDICKYQLKKIKQNYFSNISKIIRKKHYWEITLKDKKKFQSRGLIITCPYPQLKKLAKKYLNKSIMNLNVKMDPNITLMLAINNNKKLPISSIKFEDDILSWAANENSKGRFNAKIDLWTLQSTVKWARKMININKTNNKPANVLKSRFLKILGIENNRVMFFKSHGWKYSYSSRQTKMKSYWDVNKSLGVCGDWFIGPKFENAWQSACDLSKKVKKNPLKYKRV